MTQRDQWSERLRCPKCGATGNVVLSQAKPDSNAYHDGRDQNVRAEIVPNGFRSEVTDIGYQFYCVGCSALAEQLP
jgi:hypothetical protein